MEEAIKVVKVFRGGGKRASFRMVIPAEAARTLGLSAGDRVLVKVDREARRMVVEKL